MKIDLKKFDFESDQILGSLDKQEIELINQHSESLQFKKGKLIFYEGGIPTGVFLLIEGRAKILKTGNDGRDQIFYIYKPGDILGYHALLSEEVYEDACEALEPCQMKFISVSNFIFLMENIPSLRPLLIKNMSHEFGVLVNTITIMAQKPLRERVAIYLLVLDQRYDESPIDLPRDDFANLVGTARESLGRVLKDFKEEELISIDGRMISLNDRQKLHAIASL